jgi:hypothetical protein
VRRHPLQDPTECKHDRAPGRGPAAYRFARGGRPLVHRTAADGTGERCQARLDTKPSARTSRRLGAAQRHRTAQRAPVPGGQGRGLSSARRYRALATATTQRTLVAFTPKRSLVRSQYRPQDLSHEPTSPGQVSSQALGAAASPGFEIIPVAVDQGLSGSYGSSASSCDRSSINPTTQLMGTDHLPDSGYVRVHP